MNKLQVLLVGVALMFALGACGGSTVEKYSKLVDEMCACKDKDCADKVWKKRRDLRKDSKKPGKSDMEKIRGYDKKMRECREKLDKGGSKSGAAVKTLDTTKKKADVPTPRKPPEKPPEKKPE